MDELIEQMAARSPTGPPCPSCGHDTHLVVYGEQWCSRCRVLRPCAEDPRLVAYSLAEEHAARGSTPLRLAVGGRKTRAA